MSQKFHNFDIILANSEVSLLVMMQWLLTDLHIHTMHSHERWGFRAIENLLVNALKYTPVGGRIDVTVTFCMQLKDGGIVEISVKDTGIGILREDLERIFEPYYRGRNASAETGAGLGLSLVKEVVAFHGGKVLVQSKLHKGTTFLILLPIEEDPQERRWKLTKR